MILSLPKIVNMAHTENFQDPLQFHDCRNWFLLRLQTKNTSTNLQEDHEFLTVFSNSFILYVHKHLALDGAFWLSFKNISHRQSL